MTDKDPDLDDVLAADLALVKRKKDLYVEWGKLWDRHRGGARSPEG